MKTIHYGKIAVVVILLVIGLALMVQAGEKPLEKPETSSSELTFLEQEAGITAYTKVGRLTKRDLLNAEQVYKNVERKTDKYIVGSISLSNYGESSDVHIYADVSGWVAAYYLGDEPVAKILDWKDHKGGKITSTKLEDALVKFTKGINSQLPFTKYYDFRYPDATKIMVITDAEKHTDTQTFKILIPGSYTIFSREWSLYFIVHDGCEPGECDGGIKIDGTELKVVDQDHSGIWEGSITPTQLSPGQYHVVAIYNNEPHGQSNSFGAIVLVYKE